MSRRAAIRCPSVQSTTQTLAWVGEPCAPPRIRPHPSPDRSPTPPRLKCGSRVTRGVCLFPTHRWKHPTQGCGAPFPGALRGQSTSASVYILELRGSFHCEVSRLLLLPALPLLRDFCHSSEWPVPLGTPAAGAATAERCSYFAPRCTIVIAAWHVCPIRCAALIRLVAYPVEACAELRIRRAAACRTRRLRSCAADPSHASIGRSTDARSSRSIVGHVRRPTVQSNGCFRPHRLLGHAPPAPSA